MKSKVFIVLILLTGTFFVYAAGETDMSDSSIDIIKDYKLWDKINEDIITGDTTGFMGMAHRGPDGFRNIYINAKGTQVAFGEKEYPFPEGTIVVKEVFANNDGAQGDLMSLTIMIKRAEGYDPGHGDWEYIMTNPAFEVQAQGIVEMCIGCHDSADDKDYIFWNSTMNQ